MWVSKQDIPCTNTIISNIIRFLSFRHISAFRKWAPFMQNINEQRKYRFFTPKKYSSLIFSKGNMQKLSASGSLQNAVSPRWYIDIETYNGPLGIRKLLTCHLTLPICCKFTKGKSQRKRWSWIFYETNMLNFWLPVFYRLNLTFYIPA